jgi:hypothetical protein
LNTLRRITKILICCFLLTVSAKAALCQTDNPRLPLHVEILQTPALAFAGGGKYIVYELHLTSFYPGTITLQKIEVLPANSRKTLFEYGGEILARNLKHIVASPDASAPRALDYGRRVVLFAWIPLDKTSLIPPAIMHRLTVAVGNRIEPITMLTAPQKINRAMPAVVSPPLRGAGWLAGNGPQPDFVTAHNRLLAPLFGPVRVPQRFATDWVKYRSGRKTVSKRDRAQRKLVRLRRAGFGGYRRNYHRIDGRRSR